MRLTPHVRTVTRAGHNRPHEQLQALGAPPRLWLGDVTNEAANTKPALAIEDLWRETPLFSRLLTETPVEGFFGTTDGKAIGTYVEHEFHRYLKRRYDYEEGSSAFGVDFPDLCVDLKVTSSMQPQSSSPFADASQKVYGLGYSLLILVYAKEDDDDMRAARLRVMNAVYIDALRTADHQTTKGIIEILERQGSADDLAAYFRERDLPLDDAGRARLAERVLDDPPTLGYLTISNALQWRLQYGRALKMTTDSPHGLKDLLT